LYYAKETLYLFFLIAKKQADAVAMVASVTIEGIINFFISFASFFFYLIINGILYVVDSTA